MLTVHSRLEVYARDETTALRLCLDGVTAVVVVVAATGDLVLDLRDTLLEALLAPLARARGLVLHHAAVAHRELVLLLRVELLAVALAQIVLVLDLCCALRDLCLALDAVVRLVTAGSECKRADLRWGEGVRLTVSRAASPGCKDKISNDT